MARCSGQPADPRVSGRSPPTTAPHTKLRPIVICASLGHFLSVARKATVLPITPAGVEMGTSTSILCSPLEPQAMDCSKVCGAETTVVPSTAIACEAAESMRDMLTITWEDDELPGQSTRNIKRVVIT